jgi:Zn-dependent protease/DNA-binding MarR family transcriptional regulator
VAFGRDRTVTGAPREAFRPSAIFIGLVALFAVSGWMAWAGVGAARLSVFLFVVSGWVLSLCLHEYAHALLAYRGGDHAVAERGYLTLNPLKYTHPLLSIALPVVFLLIGGIGLPGGAVWVDRHAVRSRAWSSAISFAGPAMNLLFTLVMVIPFGLGLEGIGGARAFWAALAFLAFLQLTASLLNLMPIPGVDGGNVIEPWLSPQWQRGFGHVAPYGMLLLMALLLSPRINGAFFLLVDWLGDLLGLPASAGEDAALATRLRLAVGRLNRRIRLATNDVPPLQLSALVTLERHGPLRSGELAQREAVTAPTMTRVLTALTERGLVTRSAHPEDARSVMVAVTEEGAQTLSRIRSQRTALLGARLARLTPEQRAALDAAIPAIEALVDD